jgi:hypothetical protein
MDFSTLPENPDEFYSQLLEEIRVISGEYFLFFVLF